VWLEDVFQGIDVWMSGHDISAGARWGVELNAMLEASSFGILCLTPESINSPWILFEAGSLAKAVEAARVVPYLFELSPADVRFPLAQFQGVQADRMGTYSLVESINNVRAAAMDGDRLQRTFDLWWPRLEEKLKSVPRPTTKAIPLRTERELLEELIEIVRGQQKMQDTPTPITPLIAADTNLVASFGEVLHSGDLDVRQMGPEVLAAHVGELEGQLQDAKSVQQINLNRQLQAARREVSRREVEARAKNA